MAVPFESKNVLALDGAVPGSVTTVGGGVTQWDSQGTSGNSFFNDHADTSRPAYSNPNVTFDGGDHLHRDPDAGPLGLIPATGDWAWVCRLTPTLSEVGVIFTQYQSGSGDDGRLTIQRTPAGDMQFFVGDTSRITGGSVPLNTPGTVTAGRAGTVQFLRVGGVQVAVNTITQAIMQTGNLIGAQGFSSDYDSSFINFLTGSIHRVGLWHGTFSEADLAAMEAWAEAGDFGGGGSTFSQRRKRFSP